MYQPTAGEDLVLMHHSILELKQEVNQVELEK